jgi:DMSO reductase family type II enzyme heme b subunit
MLFVLAAVAAAVSCSRGPRIDRLQVTAKRVPGPLPREDPASGLWSQAPEHPARLMVQDVTEPRLIQPGVELVAVRALHDGEWIVFRLEWADPTEDRIPESGRTADAAALQFPVEAGPDVPDAAKGEKGKGVRIWCWKALWQDDAERAASGKDRVAVLYPNATADHYPFAVSQSDPGAAARRYAPAVAAGNPIAVRPGAAPVQVLQAEGFGDTRPAADQTAAGRGRWSAGTWTVTVARKLAAGPGATNLEPGVKSYVAFAVWDGAARHAGARKMRSGWTPLVVEAR